MPQLTDLMRADPALLQAIFRTPAVTAFNRLEARPRAHDLSRSLRAEVRDATWLLTRQWQLGELEAEDAASPVDARLLTRCLAVDRVKLGADGAVQPYDDSLPLEAMVEREAVPFTLALRVQAGQYFLRLHSPALRAKYLTGYRGAFALPAGAEADFRGQVDGLNLYRATSRLGIDGGAVLASIAAGTFDADASIDAADVPAISGYMTALQGWLQRQYVQPVAGAPTAWDSGRLAYGVSVAAPGDAGEQKTLVAPRFAGGHLDWEAFDLAPGAPPLVVDDPAYVPPAPVTQPMSFIPVAAQFKGMPNPRFWEMEERQVNFGALDAQTTDQLLLVFAELGLVYGNDWFVVPYSLPVNSLCEVTGFVVTDVFGDRTVIRAADEGLDSDWQRWSLFELSNQGEVGSYNHLMLLSSSVGATLESDPIERVQFVRDEMANMVWAVEEVIPDATGRGIDGNDAADKTGVLPEPIAGSPAAIRYLLGTTVPENWIPFLPTQRPGAAQDIAFQRAAMPQMGVPPHDVVRAKGVLLNEAALPYMINEEDIPYAGTIVTRSYRRARWYDGRTCLWIARQRTTGRGIASSNLRFDQIEPV